MPRRTSHGVADADQHLYEPEDAILRHLEPKFREIIHIATIDGRRLLEIQGNLFDLEPFVGFERVAAPGTIECSFRGQNPDGLEYAEMIGEPIAMKQTYQQRDARVVDLDRHGIDFTWVLPTLLTGLEERLRGAPEAAHAVMHAYNRWVEDDWGFASDDRIHVPAALSLLDVDLAEAELRRVLDAGARSILLRPAPVAHPDCARSLGDPAHDRFWSIAAEAEVPVIFHGSDSGGTELARAWGDVASAVGSTAFSMVLGLDMEWAALATATALVTHGVLDRHRDLKVVFIENGTEWLPYLFQRLERTYAAMPQHFASDPLERIREQCWFVPFYDNVPSMVDLVGARRVMYGSDWPHPEGVANPRAGLHDLADLGDEVRRLVQRDNLLDLVGMSRPTTPDRGALLR